MGGVVANLRIANGIDEALASRGVLSVAEVRVLELHEILVDTGATTISLPASMIETLGLVVDREVWVFTATGRQPARIFKDTSLSVLGRQGTFECLELPEGSQPLLGVLPLETLGIELDLQHERLVLLPPEAYLRI